MQRPGGHAVAGDTVRTVAAGHEVAAQQPFRGLVPERDLGVVDPGDLGLEQQGSPRVEAGGDEVLDHLLLPVHGDGPAGQLFQVDAVTLAVEAQLDAPVHQALAAHPATHTELVEQPRGVVFQHPRTDPAFHIGSGAAFDDDRCDAGPFQEPGQHQAGRPGADDAHLRPHPHHLHRCIDVRR